MRWNTEMAKSSLSFVLFAAACSGSPSSVQDPAETTAMPLTAATQSVATFAAMSGATFAAASSATSSVGRHDLAPPWSLTASDGSGLALTRVDAKVVLEGPLAYTELHLYFHNLENRQREGTFSITLPQRATVSRFAMETNGQMMEAEVVEKMIARRAYDDFLHRRQDPALLEKSEGNQFSAKVFPIPANSDKHIVISYSQELPGARYVLPLRGLPNIDRIDVELATLGGDGRRSTQALRQRKWTPDRDFISDVSIGAKAIASGTMIATQVEVFDATQRAVETPSAMTLMVDTSASRGLGYDSYVKSVRALIGKLPTTMPLDVIAFDQDREAIFNGKAGEWGNAHDKKLIDRGAAGASDLAQALVGIATHAKSRVVIVTDGVITAGAQHAELVAAAKQIRAQRIDVVLAGGIRDDVAATELVRALPRAGAVVDLDDGADAVAQALAAPVKTDVKIEIPGATWVYPNTLASVRAGTSAMVYARMGKPAQELDVIVGGVNSHVVPRAGTAPLVERAVVSAEIQQLEAKLANANGTQATELKRDIAHRSVAARVVSSQTSLLVLESDSDYARYGIDRKALADVLVVAANGTIVRTHRQAPHEMQQIAASSRAQDPQLKQETRRNRRVGAAAPSAKAASEPEGDGVAFDAKNDSPAKKGKAEGIDAMDDGRAERDVAGSAVSDNVATSEPKPADATPRPVVAQSMPAPASPTVSPRLVPVQPPAPESSPAQSRPHRIARESADHHSARGVAARSSAADRDMPLEQERRDPWPPQGAPAALTGELAAIANAIAHRDVDGALAKARDWHAKEPGNVLALIGLGDALEAKGSLVTASRVYGSIIDLFPARADMRRFAGERLSRIARTNSAVGNAARDLIVDTYRRAVEDRPDHMTGHRLLAYALVRANRPAEAFEAILAAIDQPYRNDSYAGGQRTLADDAGMIAASYLAAVPAKKAEIMGQLAKRRLQLATQPSTRFILYWETDANDVDFHIQDSRGGHAFYGNKLLRSGGELYADITTGYGPECFAIPGTPQAGPYRLSINYYSQGPMGFGMGLLEVQRFDGKAGLSFEDRPYVIMADHAYVDLGSWQ